MTSKAYELRVATRLARWLRDHGRAADGRDLIAPIYARFTGGVCHSQFSAAPIKIESHAVGLALAGPQTAVGVRLTVGSSRYCVVYRRPNFRRDLVNQVVAVGYSTPPLDCADKRMRFALAH